PDPRAPREVRNESEPGPRHHRRRQPPRAGRRGGDDDARARRDVAQRPARRARPMTERDQRMDARRDAATGDRPARTSAGGAEGGAGDFSPPDEVPSGPSSGATVPGYAGPSRHTVTIKLARFEGPLDLLLHLIKRDEINIHDIPISHITQQYLAYIELMRALDLEVAGEFLVMAATLL